MSGTVSTYSGTSLTVNVTNIKGTGTYNGWTILVSGVPGVQGATGSSGTGSGDVLAVNNGSEFTNKATLRSNIGLGSAALNNTSDFTSAATGASLQSQISALGSASAAALINDSTFGTASTTNINSASATKTYVDNKVATVGVPTLTVQYKVFTSTGTWTKPANLKYVKIEIKGGGGGSGGRINTGARACGIGGGGEAETSFKINPDPLS